jgi:hypothetical protein
MRQGGEEAPRCVRGGAPSAHRPAGNTPGEEIDDDGDVKHVRSDGGRLPLTQTRRQAATPARTCFERINRSIRCRPHKMPFVSNSRQTRLAHKIVAVSRYSNFMLDHRFAP